MEVVRILAKTDPDGRVRLTFPCGEPGSYHDLAIVIAPHHDPAPAKTPEELGWPPGFLENVVGSIDDDTFVAPPRFRPEPAGPAE